MFEQLEALRALRDTGTTGLAAARLRITQSAVSKRIAALEDRVGAELTERVGRRVVLTPEGTRVLHEVAPLVRELEAVLGRHVQGGRAIRVGAVESLLASWLAGALKEASSRTGVALEIHAHRGPVLVEHVRSGRYLLAIGVEAADPELVARVIAREPMVIVGAERWSRTAPVAAWTIEESSLTWSAIAPGLKRSGCVTIAGRNESFAALVQLARAGFAPALVPAGVAHALGARGKAVAGVTRPIAVIARPSVHRRPDVRRLVRALTGLATTRSLPTTPSRTSPPGA